MDHNDESQRLYQQYPERSQSGMHNTYSASTMAARFRHPSTVHTTSGPDQSQTQAFSGPGSALLDSSHYAGSPLQVQTGFHYPQYTTAEQMGYAAQHQQQATQYSHAYFYNGQQATSSTDLTPQEQMQRYQSTVGRNHSIASTTSQYSLPQTPQLQYFGSSQAQQYPSRTDAHQTPVSHEALPYTQPSGYSGQYQTAGQMLPPSTFGAYGQQGQHQQRARTISDIDEAYETYQTKAREIFTLVREGKLRETHERLLHISQYLLGNAEALGTYPQPARMLNAPPKESEG